MHRAPHFRFIHTLAFVILAGCGGGSGDGVPRLDPACGFVEPPGRILVDLGEEGLRENDLIDPYLEEWVKENHQVHIPSGIYRWNGGGFTGKELYKTSVVGDGPVVLDAGDGHTWTSEWVIEGGFELRNIILRGRRAPGDSTFRVMVTNSNASAAFVNVSLPDGSWDAGAAGIHVQREHAGTFWFIDTRVERFARYGLHASDPGLEDGRNGAVHVVRGYFRNNNLGSIRLGSDGSSIAGSVIVNDQEAPGTANGTVNQRGIRIRHVETGEDIRIEDVHITQSEPGRAALVIDGEPGGSGTIRGLRVNNSIDNPPIRVETEESSWSGSNIHITGNGNPEPEGTGDFSDICTGEDCIAPANQKPARLETCS